MKILNKCPICGGKLEYNMLCQYTNIYGIKRNGDLTERRKRKETLDLWNVDLLLALMKIL